MPGWFRRREKPTLIDADLGELTRSEGYWWGEVRIPAAGTTVHLAVRDAGGKPSAGAWATIQNFDGRYRELRPALATELHRLLEPWHREFFTGARPLEESELLLERFELESIEVDPPEVKVLAFSLKEGWDDALFRVSVDGWTPRAVAVED